jgi:ABC-2 type transport system ATP-binding protein
MSLEIKNLSKTYSNGVKALKGIDLTIDKGMFGLLGPNGAGKSTLMRTIATLQEPDEGTIFFDGIDVLKEKDKIRSLLGYLPQEFGVYPRISAEALLDHLAVLKGISDNGERKDLVSALLNKTNLYQHRKKNIGGYSGGMKQRFGIAQALIATPKLIIVDEPTAGLDPAERNRYLNLLGEISDDTIVVLSTHIVEDVRELCTDMAIINNGEVLLKTNPVAAIDSLKGTIWKKVIDKKELDQYKTSYNVISEKLLAGKPNIHVFSKSDPGNGFIITDPGLEEVYFSQIFGVKEEAI